MTKNADLLKIEAVTKSPAHTKKKGDNVCLVVIPQTVAAGICGFKKTECPGHAAATA